MISVLVTSIEMWFFLPNRFCAGGGGFAASHPALEHLLTNSFTIAQKQKQRIAMALIENIKSASCRGIEKAFATAQSLLFYSLNELQF